MTLFEDTALRITARQPESGTQSRSVLLSFTGIGHAMGGLDVQKPEFFGTGRAFDNILFITDKTRSWANRLDFAQIAGLIAPLVGDRRVFAIGNSMGGFNAIVSTRHIPTEMCIAFAPQFSVKPSIVPWEWRWADYRGGIGAFRIDSVEGHFVDGTRYVLISGGEGPDGRHAGMFPVRDNIRHYRFPGIAHDVAAVLKERQALDPLLQGCFSGQATLPLDLAHEVLSPAAP